MAVSVSGRIHRRSWGRRCRSRVPRRLRRTCTRRCRCAPRANRVAARCCSARRLVEVPASCSSQSSQPAESRRYSAPPRTRPVRVSYERCRWARASTSRSVGTRRAITRRRIRKRDSYAITSSRCRPGRARIRGCVWRVLISDSIAIAGTSTGCSARRVGIIGQHTDRCVVARSCRVQPYRPYGCRRYDGDVDEHGHRRAYVHIGRERVELGDRCSWWPVLVPVLNRGNVLVSLRDSPRDDGHGCRPVTRTVAGGGYVARVLKYAIAFVRPSSRPTVGSHPSKVRARVMSGFLCLGSSTGRGR